MGTTTRATFEEFQKAQGAAPEGVRYELDEGELVVTPSPTPLHNIVRYRLRRAVTDFVQKNSLGIVLDETDFRLSANVVRKPDVAFIVEESLRDFDFKHTPVDIPPALAVEVISPNNLAQDTLKKVHQYLAAGSHAVWLVYPDLRLIEVHDENGIREIIEPNSITNERLLKGFAPLLSDPFSDNPRR